MDQSQAVGIHDLLQTKLLPPRLNRLLVERAALLARLDAGLERKLTLLSAPAGFGKTTLVSQWVKQKDEGGRMKDEAEEAPLHPAKVAWLALDAGDNDPVRFWRYCLTACRRFGADLGAAALAQLHTRQPPSFETLLTLFLNELAALPQADTVRNVLVLEDYHVITNAQIHASLTFLLDHLPPTLHLVMTTRHDPPLPLARLRARLAINELTAADLRFSLLETTTFLQQTLSLPLPPAAIARLDARTEGWVTGLRLATLALQNRTTLTDVEHFLDTFGGGHSHILAYLIEEVFRVQPAPLQTFLLQTTFLPRLTASLCDAVTNRNDSASRLAELERANLFLLPLDGAHQWYRYQALFAEALQHQARRRLGEAGLAALYARASQWYEQHGFLGEAIESALAIQECGRAALLIERAIARQPVVNNEYHTLRRWLEQLPVETLATHPMLSFTYAVAILFTGDQRAPATMALLQGPLALAEERWRTEGNQPQLGRALGFRALVTWWQGDLRQAFAAARQALDLLPPEDLFWRGLGLLGVGAEGLAAGKLKSAREALLEARIHFEAAGDAYTALSTTFTLGEVCARRGELHQAVHLYRQVLDGITGAAPRTIAHWADFDHGRALIGLAALCLEWNQLETAEQQLAQALAIGRRLADEELQVHSSLLLARIKQVCGETAQVQALLQELIARTSPRWPLLRREVRAEQARVALASGDLTAVQHWADTCSQPAVDVPWVQQEQEQLIVARLRIAQGQTDGALPLFAEYLADARAQERGRSEVEILILTALVYARRRQPAQARQTLCEALILAQPEGYQRLFLDEGEPLAALLRALLPDVKEPSLAAYGQTLLRAFAAGQTGAAGQSQVQNPKAKIQNLIEPLSERELEVLRLLYADLSGPAIAAALIVSVNTVKTHIKHIYGKLNARSRYEAIERAKQLNLL